VTFPLDAYVERPVDIQEGDSSWLSEGIGPLIEGRPARSYLVEAVLDFTVISGWLVGITASEMEIDRHDGHVAIARFADIRQIRIRRPGATTAGTGAA
jgi:hypothetical protein